MKILLKIEEFALLGIAVLLNQHFTPYAWWWYWVLFLAPDLSMVGYLFNTKTGAFCYNLVHHKGLTVLCFILGYFITSPGLQFTGLLLLGHSSFDRIMGYGLKYPDHFKHTHLGWIGLEK